MLGELEKNGFRFVAKVPVYGSVQKRGEFFAALDGLRSARCAFRNLPMAPGPFEEGVTAEAMRDFVWLRPEVPVRVDFAERLGNGLLRHPELSLL